MSGGKVQIVLHFPGSTETWSLKQPPRRGQRIQSRSGEAWFVVDVLQCGINTYTVTCVGRADFMQDLRQRPPVDLASDLLAATRRPIRSNGSLFEDPQHAVSRGLKREEDWIEKYLSYAAKQGEAGTRTSIKSLSKRPSERRDDRIEKYLAGGRGHAGDD